MQHKGGNTHQSLERALDILTAFTPDNVELGATEISEKIGGLHRSTVTRILQVLTRRGFLQQNPSTKKYSLGRSAARIGRAVAQSLDSRLVNIAQPHVDALRNAVGETAALEVFSETNTILAYYAKGPRLVQVSFRIGDRMPIHVAAGAKAVLAFLPIDIAESLIPQKLIRFTPHTITNRKGLLKQLAEIRKSGVATDCGERDEDVHVIAAPVFNHENRPVAAVVISVPVSRKETLTDPETIVLLKETTAAISARLLN
ncbi:MAG: IclR family transcriptional regulator [Deltaproteobacteria bacterium]|nr:IclR family transcriptional regulator [Deltaproteobacteria bacterium]